MKAGLHLLGLDQQFNTLYETPQLQASSRDLNAAETDQGLVTVELTLVNGE